MAFLAVQKKLTNTMTSLYTTPASKSSIVFSGLICNIDDTTNKSTVEVDVQLTSGSTTTNLLKAVPIVYGGSLVLPKVVVPTNGVINAAATSADSSNKIDVTLSILEQDA